MTKTITRDDVLRYIFNETSEEESLAIEKQLIVNSGLMDFYRKSSDMVKRIENLQLEPSEASMSKILRFSDAHRVESIS